MFINLQLCSFIDYKKERWQITENEAHQSKTFCYKKIKNR